MEEDEAYHPIKFYDTVAFDYSKKINFRCVTSVEFIDGDMMQNVIMPKFLS